MTITLDPGHGRKMNAGAVKGYYEGDMTLKLAEYYKTELEAYGQTVIMTRETEQNIPEAAADRGTIAAENGSDMMISLHSNTGGGKYVVVIPSVKYKGDTSKEKIYKFIETAITDVFRRYGAVEAKTKGLYYLTLEEKKPQDYPGDKRDYYGVLRNSVISDKIQYSIIVEHGFHDNEAQCKVLMNDSALKDMAAAAVKSMADHFKWERKGTITMAHDIKLTCDTEAQAKELIKILQSAKLGSGTSATPVPETTTELKKGDFVKIKSGSKYYGMSSTVPDKYISMTWVVNSVSGDRVVVMCDSTGKTNINSAFYKSDLTKV